MALTGDSFQAMEFLWGELPKAPDDDHATFVHDEIDALWHAGFVDAERFDLAAWRAAFADHRRPDGTYILSKAEFFAKDPYRYKGEIRVPFNALLINEGQYTDEGLQELIDESIRPSVRVDGGLFAECFDQLKRAARQPNGLLLIDGRAKQRIRRFIEQYPSPRRQLELIFDAMIRKQMVTAAITGQLPTGPTIAAVPRTEGSTFSLNPHNPAEAQAVALRGIAKVRARSGAEIPTQPATPLRRLHHPRRGVRA